MVSRKSNYSTGEDTDADFKKAFDEYFLDGNGSLKVPPGSMLAGFVQANPAILSLGSSRSAQSLDTKPILPTTKRTEETVRRVPKTLPKPKPQKVSLQKKKVEVVPPVPYTEFLRNTMLPANNSEAVTDFLSKNGFVYKGPVPDNSDLAYYDFPTGWKKRKTGRVSYFLLVNQSRKYQASIIYIESGADHGATIVLP